jgi:4-amino-4-deoxy-L-arabinose transferase-like glycosyltransferase
MWQKSGKLLKSLNFLNYYWLIFFVILAVHFFFRFYQLETRSQFSWDQVDNAWVAKDLIINHKWPLVGMQAKLNSGIFIGPLYYYFISLFYFLSGLDPIAAVICAGVTSLINFSVLFLVTKKIFGKYEALLAVFIYAVSFNLINFDRVQWPVDFIPAISLLVFYFLYRFLQGNTKYLLFLAIMVGLSFHIHFTSIFYPIIIICCLPLFPRNLKTIYYGILSVFILALTMLPSVISYFNNLKSNTSNISSFSFSYNHGLHLTRVLQLTGDALIGFDKLLFQPFGYLKFVLLPLFIIFLVLDKSRRQRFILGYLTLLWYFVPWLIFSMYSGELSDYYFSINLPIAIIILAVISLRVFRIKLNFNRQSIKRLSPIKYLPGTFIILFWLYFSILNVNSFFHMHIQSLSDTRTKVIDTIKRGQKIEFTQGAPESYLYYYYIQIKSQK